MKLLYRGLTYDCNPHKAYNPFFQQVREPGVAYNLIYRGVTYRVDPNAKPEKVTEKTVTYKLIYRGMTYLVNRNVFV